MKPRYLFVRSAILACVLSIPALASKMEPQNVQAGAKKQSVPAEQTRQQEEQANIEKYKAKMAAVDEKFKAAADMMRAQPPNFDQAIETLIEATRMAPEQDAVWYRLGVAYLGSANAQADAAEKARRSTEAYNDLERAVDLYEQRKSQELKENTSKAPCNVEGVCTHVEKVKVGAVSDEHKIAVYYSNLGDAAARLGKTEEASHDFQQAAQLDPADAGTYYFDLGIILRNAAKSVDQRKQAVQAFDQAIAADPNKAADYYLKGEVLFGMATADEQGKIIPQPGTVEALQKYLQLEPNGPYAQRAQSFLAALNTRIESNNGLSKETTKKK
jgi:tetratricopeptide (TPR) repeat protein